MQTGKPLLIWPIFLEHAKVMQISTQIPTRQMPPWCKGRPARREEGSKVRVTHQGPHCRDRRGFGVQAWSGGCLGSAAPAALRRTPLSHFHSSI